MSPVRRGMWTRRRPRGASRTHRASHSGLAATMTWSQAELEALRKAYGSGTLRVSYDGRSAEYGTEADLMRRIRTIESEMAAAEGRPRPKRSLATFRKG